VLNRSLHRLPSWHPLQGQQSLHVALTTFVRTASLLLAKCRQVLLALTCCIPQLVCLPGHLPPSSQSSCQAPAGMPPQVEGTTQSWDPAGILNR
jgi:hypothetical protein